LQQHRAKMEQRVNQLEKEVSNLQAEGLVLLNARLNEVRSH